ncbi:MAG: iron-sulfur cluster-binding protein [Alphaproteobacteria bacterium]|nr:MAG: iron-sulfur cluster-binding protein [Alphaproteobacteria bacterium]
MKSTTSSFKENVHSELQNENLKRVFGGILQVLPLGRAMAMANLPEFDALRDQARDIKNHTLENLDFYLEAFEAKVIEQGGHVHWCETHEEARDTVLKICQTAGAKTVTKGKSMITEEMGLNAHLEANGIEPIETDMGEYIIQLAGETPSHLIGPAFHKSKEEVTELFYEHHKTQRWTEGEDLMAEGRKVLREKYFAADVGITGANFLIAETGSTVIVTNEGNGDLTQTLPKVHIVCASIEKVVPTLEDFSQLIRVLPRSATGQEITAYTTLSTGPRRADDLDGPDEFHVVLLDAGRSKYLGTEVQEVLRCIRCSACLNHCPIYSAIGGHAYGWVYQGPIGAALDPLLLGTMEAAHLPNASTLCGRCEAVCPVRIPIPKILRHWRTEAHRQGFGTVGERSGLAFWAFFARRPWLYSLGAAWMMKALGAWGANRGAFKSLPFLSGWTLSRDMPAPEGETFQSAWKKAQKEGRSA